MNNADFAQDEEIFSIWLEEFKDAPFKQSASEPLIGECLESIRFNPEVIEKYSNQAEFMRSMGEYVGIAASEARAEAGRSKLAANRETLPAIEDLYGVDAAILISIWGIETDYGRLMGDFRVLDSLATLAGCGARREFFEAELKAAVRIVLSGAIGIPEFKGSWAGAMGHTQFMPTSYLEFAVSFQGGRKSEIWGACPSGRVGFRSELPCQARLEERRSLVRGSRFGARIRLLACDRSELDGCRGMASGGGAFFGQAAFFGIRHRLASASRRQGRSRAACIGELQCASLVQQGGGVCDFRRRSFGQDCRKVRN